MALAAVFAVLPPAAAAQTRVVFPSLDGGRAEPVMLSARWLRSAAVVGQARPAAVLLHGCGGLWQDEGAGRLDPALSVMADALVDAGWHVLLVDSLRPRGVLEACSAKIAARSVKAMHRVRDALGALEWLAQQDGVDATQLALVGLDEGASVALAAADRRHPVVRQAPVAARTVLAVDPDCPAGWRDGADAAATVRVLLSPAAPGAAHEPCATQRAAARTAPRFEVKRLEARAGESTAALLRRRAAASADLLRAPRNPAAP